MGCDIHPVVQVREKGKWHHVELPGATLEGPARWDHPIYGGLTGRNYDRFAVLGNVRNGRGFAGIPTGEYIKPISDNRGLPEDFETPVPAKFSKYPDDEEAAWLGDHSFSWVTLRELLDYNWDESRVKVGVIPLKDYILWDGVSQPESWCGGVSGKDIVTVSEVDAKAGNYPRGKEVHVQIAWRRTIKDSMGTFITSVIPWLQSLGAPEDVRIVFGFDS